MAESQSDNPFAEFAAPNISGVEYLKARREQDRQARREAGLFLGILTAAVAASAAGGASMGAGIQVLPAAFGLAVAGALLGVLIGWLVGAVIWACLSFQSKAPAPFKPIGTALVRDNSWNKMTVWLSAWGTIGIACGGAFGASKGAILAAAVEAESVLPLAWCGSFIGLVDGFILWLFFQRFGRQASLETIPLHNTAAVPSRVEKAAPSHVEVPTEVAGEPLSEFEDLVAGVSALDGAELLKRHGNPRKGKLFWMQMAALTVGVSATLFAVLYLLSLRFMAPFERQDRMEAAVEHNNHGYDRFVRGDLDGALAEYDKAIELNPKCAVAYHNRGVVRAKKGDPDGALDDYNKALELDPMLAAAYGNRGVVRDQKNDWDGAIADYTKAIELQPKISNLYANRGLTYLRRGDEAKAQDDFDHYLRLRPDAKAELDEQIKMVEEERAMKP